MQPYIFLLTQPLACLSVFSQNPIPILRRLRANTAKSGLNRGQIPILCIQRIGTVKPVFASIRHNKRLTRFNHRGREKVNTQWNLYG
jgi:hypothetical protein